MNLPCYLIVGKSGAQRLKHAKILAPEGLEVSPTGIEEIREIRKLVSLGQSIILNDAHNLTIEAQNALLKTLEEPPENTQIILSTPSEELLLPTVVSRCVISDLGNLSHLEISSPDQKDLEKILDWVGESDLKMGFGWSAKAGTDRKVAIETIDKLLIVAHQHLQSPLVIRKLFSARKYLSANTNVRLTLENLFLA